MQQQQVPAAQPKGTVVEMDPKAGTTVEPGQTITLYVSNGVPMTMPDLTGQTVDQAFAALQQEGWRAPATRSRSRCSTRSAARSTITNQLPAAGSPLGRNDPVSVIVSEFGFGN